MRKVYIAVAVAGIFIAVLASAPFVFEYNRIQSLCRSHHSRVATTHDAIDVMRNHQEASSAVGRVLSIARHLDTFRRDGYAPSRIDDGGVTGGGGWHVEEWNEPLVTRGYSVGFADYDFQFDIRCNVLECGAIDSANCLTMGIT